MKRVSPITAHNSDRLPPINPKVESLIIGNQNQNGEDSAIAMKRQIRQFTQHSEPIERAIEAQDGNYITLKIRSKNAQSNQQMQKKQQINVKQNFLQFQSVYTCRICLQQGPALHANSQSQLQDMLSKLQEEKKLKQPQYLISACGCHGTAGYIHQRCMIQWIDAQHKRTKQKQMQCQICLSQILYNRKYIRQFDCDLHCDDVSSCNIICTGSLLVLIAICIALQIKWMSINLTIVTRGSIYGLIGLMTIILVFSIIIMINDAFFKTKKLTVKVYTNDEVEILGIRKENLTHYDHPSTTHRTTHRQNGQNGRSIRSIRSARSIAEQQNARSARRNGEILQIVLIQQQRSQRSQSSQINQHSQAFQRNQHSQASQINQHSQASQINQHSQASQINQHSQASQINQHSQASLRNRRSQRSSRTHATTRQTSEVQQSNIQQLRSARNIRSVRQHNSLRSIQIVSRQHAEELHQHI